MLVDASSKTKKKICVTGPPLTPPKGRGIKGRLGYRPQSPMILLPNSDEQLLQECEVQTFRSSGPGGQHVNKTESGVRLKHLPTGVVVSSQQERSQHRNKAICIKKLRKKIERLNYRAPKRVPTKASRAAKERTLQEKSRRAKIKKLRSRQLVDE